MEDHLWRLLEQAQGKLIAVQADFATAKHRYNELKESSESRVCHWEWSSSLPRYEMDPLYFLNDTARRGRVTRKQPASIKHKHQYGFDSSGRLVVGRDHSEFPGQFYEEFFAYGPSEITSFLYQYGANKEPINCRRLALADGIPISYHSRATYGAQSHVYVLEAGLIRYFCSLHAPDNREPFGGSGELALRGAEDIELWRHLPNGGRELAFSGSRTCYNTLVGIAVAGANNSFKPKPLRGSA